MLTLHVQAAEVRQHQLTLTYELKNEGSERVSAHVFLYDGQGKKGYDYWIDRDMTFRDIVDGRGVIRKMVPEVPLGLKLEQPFVPLAVVLAPGDAFRETIKLPYPLTTKLPYGQVSREQRVSEREMMLEIGYFMVADDYVPNHPKTNVPQAMRLYPLSVDRQRVVSCRFTPHVE